jgi:hypothetical protein
MTTTIRVQCPACDTLADVPEGAVLLAGAEPHAAVTDAADASISWVCQGCGRLADVTVEAPVLAALLAAGVAPLATDYSDPRPEHPEHAAGGALFTPDDLLELHEQLQTDVWFTALTSGCGRP